MPMVRGYISTPSWNFESTIFCFSLEDFYPPFKFSWFDILDKWLRKFLLTQNDMTNKSKSVLEKPQLGGCIRVISSRNSLETLCKFGLSRSYQSFKRNPSGRKYSPILTAVVFVF